MDYQLSIKSRKIKFRDDASVKLFNPNKHSSDLHSLSRFPPTIKEKYKKSKYKKSVYKMPLSSSLPRTQSEQIPSLKLNSGFYDRPERKYSSRSRTHNYGDYSKSPRKVKKKHTSYLRSQNNYTRGSEGGSMFNELRNLQSLVGLTRKAEKDAQIYLEEKRKEKLRRKMEKYQRKRSREHSKISLRRDSVVSRSTPLFLPKVSHPPINFQNLIFLSLFQTQGEKVSSRQARTQLHLTVTTLHRILQSINSTIVSRTYPHSQPRAHQRFSE